MTLRKRHGGSLDGGHIGPVLETLPVDELPDGLPAPPDRRDSATGRFQAGNRQASAGGRARAGYRAQSARLGLAVLPEGASLTPYREHAREWRDAVAADLASTVGGGVLGPLPHALLESAAMFLMWSRFYNDQAMTDGDPDKAKDAAKFAEASGRLARDAEEYAAREAQHRPRASPASDLAAARSAFARTLTGK